MTNDQSSSDQQPRLASSSLQDAPRAWGPTGADLPSRAPVPVPPRAAPSAPAAEPIRYIAPPPMPGAPGVHRPPQTGALHGGASIRTGTRGARPPKKKSRFFSILKWRILIGALLLAVGAFLARGTTSAASLSAGDCFEDPGLADISKVTDQDCAGPHDYQVFAVVGANRSGECVTRLEAMLPLAVATDPSVVIPEDAELGEFVETENEAQGDVMCAIFSPSGQLVGSIVP